MNMVNLEKHMKMPDSHALKLDFFSKGKKLTWHEYNFEAKKNED